MDREPHIGESANQDNDGKAQQIRVFSETNPTDSCQFGVNEARSCVNRDEKLTQVPFPSRSRKRRDWPQQMSTSARCSGDERADAPNGEWSHLRTARPETRLYRTNTSGLKGVRWAALPWASLAQLPFSVQHFRHLEIPEGYRFTMPMNSLKGHPELVVAFMTFAASAYRAAEETPTIN
jgi:hypothetical protein